MKNRNKFRYSIRLTVVSVFIFATLLTVTVAIGLQYHFSHRMAIEAALSRFRLTANATGDYLSGIDGKALQSTAILAHFPGLVEEGWINADARLLFAEVMRANPIFYAIYIGFPNGKYYELVNLNTHRIIRSQLKALPEDRWVVITVDGNGDQRSRRFEYFNETFELRTSRKERSDYDPRTRPWFSNAKENSVNKTRPYLFQHLQAPGQTYSTVIASTGAVLAVDIALSSLSNYLKRQPLSQEGEIYLYRESGEIIATNQDEKRKSSLHAEPISLSEQQKNYLAGLGRIRVSNELDWPPIDYAVAGEPQGYTVDLIRLLADMTGMQVDFVNGYAWPKLLEMFKHGDLEILQPVVGTPENRRLGLLSGPILSLPYAIVTREEVALVSSLEQLTGKTLAIPQGWSVIEVIRRRFPEINIVETVSTREALSLVASGRVFATLDSSIILQQTAEQYFIKGLRFHKQPEIADLPLPAELYLLIDKAHGELATILNTALAMLDSRQKQRLSEKWFGGKGGDSSEQSMAVVPYPQLLNWQQTDHTPGRLEKTVIKGRKYFLFLTELSNHSAEKELIAAVVPTAKVLAGSLDKVKMSLLITGAVLLSLLPVSWLFASPIVRPIRRLAVETEKIKNRRYDDVTMTDSAIIEIHKLADSIMEMAQAIKQHEQELKQLMESIIRLIAQAIDDKSPYTAGHCARVPELALMLAKAAHGANKGHFKDFSFHSDEELREYRIAAWLHDCGKITTPEHIVDKATKLETIYNRIHEIRMRFEVLWRDAEIDHLKQLIDTPDRKERWVADLAEQQKRLTEDFEFVARTNIGGEFLADADLARLRALSEITWQRHFDDRLGLSQIELKRFKDAPTPLPATEHLLADKPEHIVRRFRNGDFDPKLGIHMDIPEQLYNLGELYNLSVSRGTLTAEDRFKINEHMISTIKMLENLPFPKELAKVPKYASTHHETLIGSGYPRKLTAADLTIPERILAVADIFEALTAADRPYKPPKPVSEAIEILYRKVEAGHIDRDVFELFLSSGVYREYAQRYLRPEQLDPIDIRRYLRQAQSVDV